MGRRFKYFFFILLFIGPALARGQDLSYFGIPSSEIDRIARSKGWLRLLHYRAPLLRNERSDVVSEAFFLSSEGRTNARKELEATLQMALTLERAKNPWGDIHQPTICAFPARIEFLKKELGSTFNPVFLESECSDFVKWRNGIQAKSVSLVYSSAYPNNPASMFGHTFLRLDRRPVEEESLTKTMDLFSYGVNFSATVPDQENPIKYAMYGLFGGYLGRFDLAPYYRKVNEYAYSESRDLWEYRLRFNEEDTAQLVRHLWELYSGGFFTYYFLDENCSFQILTLIDAIKPEWKLSEGFFLTVIPIETVKNLKRVKDHERTGMIESVSYRPALRERREQAIRELTSAEQERVQDLFREKSEINENDSARVLDALGLALSYEKTQKGEKFIREKSLKKVWLSRAKRTEKNVTKTSPIESRRPDLSHGTSRIALSTGIRNQGEGGRITEAISISAFEHDFLNRTPSFNVFSEVRLFRFDFRKEEQKKIRFESAHLIEMASFANDSIYDRMKSWKVGLGWSRAEDLPYRSGGAWKTEGRYGIGKALFTSRDLFYLLSAGELEQGSLYSGGFRASPGAESGVLFTPVFEKFFLQFKVQSLYDFSRRSERRWRWRFEASQAFSFDMNADIRLTLSRNSLSEGTHRFQDQVSLVLDWMY